MALARNTAWVLGAQVVAAPIQLVALVLLARWLGPATFGQYQAAVTLLWTLALTAQLGQVSATIFQIRHRHVPPAEAAGQVLALMAVAAVVATGVALALAEPIRVNLLLGAPVDAVVVLVGVLPALLAMQVLGGVARARDRFGLWAVTTLVGPGTVLVGVVALPSWVPGGLLAALGLAATAQLLATATVATGVIRDTGLAVRLHTGRLVEALRFGLAGHAWVVLGTLHERADLFLLAALRGDPVEVAVYAVAVQVANRIRMLPLALGSALYPELSEREHADRAASAARALRVGGLGVLAACAVLAVLAPPLLPLLFGSTYAAAVAPLWVLLPATALFTVRVVLGRYFQAVDRQRVNVTVEALALVVNLSLNALWIPQHGALGAALASLVSYGLLAFAIGVVFVRSTRSTVGDLVPGPDDVGAVWAAVRRQR